MKNKILLVLTGGTIDSQFEPTKDTVLPKKESAIVNYIGKLNLRIPCEYSVVCMKDSRALTAVDRKKILAAIEETGCGMVIVAHGTYTMVKTAMYLKKNAKMAGKTIVLTGSMFPLEGFYHSDAPFNLGFAVSSVQQLGSGVYIGMNGKIFAPDKVKKNIRIGVFEEKKGKN
jgi:L-asparaginase